MASRRAGSPASAAIASASASMSRGGTRIPVFRRANRLAASRNVAGDDRPGAGGGLEQGLAAPLHRRSTAAPRSPRGAKPMRTSATGAEPMIPGSAARADSDAADERSCIVGVGRTGQDELDREPAPSQASDRGDRVEHALVAQHTRDEGHGNGVPLRHRAAVKNGGYRPPSRGSARSAAGSIPSAARAAPSSGFCTTIRPRPLAAARRRATPSGGRRRRAATVVAAKPEPRPMTESIDAGARPRAETPARGRARRTAPASAPHDGGCRAARHGRAGQSRPSARTAPSKPVATPPPGDRTQGETLVADLLGHAPARGSRRRPRTRRRAPPVPPAADASRNTNPR